MSDNVDRKDKIDILEKLGDWALQVHLAENKRFWIRIAHILTSNSIFVAIFAIMFSSTSICSVFLITLITTLACVVNWIWVIIVKKGAKWQRIYGKRFYDKNKKLIDETQIEKDIGLVYPENVYEEGQGRNVSDDVKAAEGILAKYVPAIVITFAVFWTISAVVAFGALFWKITGYCFCCYGSTH